MNKEELIQYLKDVDENLFKKIDVVCIGGTAMTLLGIKLSTKDVDFNVDEKDIGIFEDALKSVEKRWGFLPDVYVNGYILRQQLPSDFKQKCIKTDLEFKNMNLLLLSSLDILLSKINRLEDKDIADIKILKDHIKVDCKEIKERYNIIAKTFREDVVDHKRKFKFAFEEILGCK